MGGPGGEPFSKEGVYLRKVEPFFTGRKEVVFALRCEDFEENISDYLDGELNREEIQRFERHMSTCPACEGTLRGVRQVRLTLGRLGESTLPASFKLRLLNRLQEEIARRRCVRLRSLAWGIALTVALAILLWPDQGEQPITSRAGYRMEEERTLSMRLSPGGRMDRLPELLRSEPHLPIQISMVSY